MLRLAASIVALALSGVSSAVHAAVSPGVDATASSDVPLSTFNSQLGPQLASHFRTEGEWTLEPVRPWTPPAGSVLEIVEYPSAPAATLFLRVRLHDPAAAAPTEFSLALRARLWRDALVSTAPLDRGVSPSLAQLETRRIDTLRDRDAVPTAAELSTLIVTRALPAGRLLTWRDVAKRPLVRRGEVIEVAAVDGPLAITMKAQAMQDGAAGDLVRVRNLESRREFPALVIAEARAEVRF